MIQLKRPQPGDAELFAGSGLFNSDEKFCVEGRFDDCLRGAEVGKISAQLRAIVGYEGVILKRGMWRDKYDRPRTAGFDSL